METKYAKLFEPFWIRGVELKNRIAMAPMGALGLLEPDGSLSERAKDYYLERARGGVGLIITSVFKVENDIDPLVHGVPLVTGAAGMAFAELAEALHGLGTKIFVQLTAGFGRVATPFMLVKQPVSASALPNYWDPSITCRELETAEVETIVRKTGEAAEILANADIDGIELHGHEGYLFDQFTTALWNRRNDKYGGNLEQRLTFSIEALREIKRRLGPDYPVQYRYGLKHYMKGWGQAALPDEKYQEVGRDIPEGVEMARLLEKHGFDSLHIDAGAYDSWYWPHPPLYQKHGCLVDMAATAKQAVSIPVIAVGRLEKPDVAERVLEEGKADMIAVGRGLLTDPHWARKLEVNRSQFIRPCIGCHDGCMGRIFMGRPLSCAVNPAVGRERLYGLDPVRESRRVMVVGGGVAGLEAARAAAVRGHQVTLYEKDNTLGGHLIPGSVPGFKKDLAALLNWYKAEIEDLRVDVALGTEVTADLIARKRPDAIVLATGSIPIIPQVEGIDHPIVISEIEMLLGEKPMGQKVVIVGGGLVGCEAALWAAEQGKQVTIVEQLPELMRAGIFVPHMNRMMLLDLLAEHQVRSVTNLTMTSITNEGVILTDKAFHRMLVEAETVVISVGFKADRALYDQLVGTTPDLYLIGDARQPRNVRGAIWDAYEVARAV